MHRISGLQHHRQTKLHSVPCSTKVPHAFPWQHNRDKINNTVFRGASRQPCISILSTSRAHPFTQFPGYSIIDKLKTRFSFQAPVGHTFTYDTNSNIAMVQLWWSTSMHNVFIRPQQVFHMPTPGIHHNISRLVDGTCNRLSPPQFYWCPDGAGRKLMISGT